MYINLPDLFWAFLYGACLLLYGIWTFLDATSPGFKSWTDELGRKRAISILLASIPAIFGSILGSIYAIKKYHDWIIYPAITFIALVLITSIWVRNPKNETPNWIAIVRSILSFVILWRLIRLFILSI